MRGQVLSWRDAFPFPNGELIDKCPDSVHTDRQTEAGLGLHYCSPHTTSCTHSHITDCKPRIHYTGKLTPSSLINNIALL